MRFRRNPLLEALLFGNSIESTDAEATFTSA
jgi:hypothetical protein